MEWSSLSFEVHSRKQPPVIPSASGIVTGLAKRVASLTHTTHGAQPQATAPDLAVLSRCRRGGHCSTFHALTVCLCVRLQWPRARWNVNHHRGRPWLRYLNCLLIACTHASPQRHHHRLTSLYVSCRQVGAAASVGWRGGRSGFGRQRHHQHRRHTRGPARGQGTTWPHHE